MFGVVLHVWMRPQPPGPAGSWRHCRGDGRLGGVAFPRLTGPCLLHRDRVPAETAARSRFAGVGPRLGADVLPRGARPPVCCCGHWAPLLAPGGWEPVTQMVFTFPFSSKLPLAPLLLPLPFPPDRQGPDRDGPCRHTLRAWLPLSPRGCPPLGGLFSSQKATWSQCCRLRPGRSLHLPVPPFPHQQTGGRPHHWDL